MSKIKIGITGQSGFVGTHLSNNIEYVREGYELVDFKDSWFENITELENFIKKCDVIVHLAAVNRHDNENYIFYRNIELSEILINALSKSTKKTHLIFSSSIQESNNSNYGNAKKIARKKLCEWAKETQNIFTGLLIPNLFGPFGKPNYNSVVATFCNKLIENETPKIIEDNVISLLYIQELCDKIFEIIEKKKNDASLIVNHSFQTKVSDILKKLKLFKKEYLINGIIPILNNNFELQLFNTFRSYIDNSSFFPINYIKKSDQRGSFIELIKSNSSGQFSYSTTNIGHVRGNHFHTRKIERFSVISGKALIEIRKVDEKQKISFILDGSKPSYVDMPVWYTHNIRNIGNTKLITNFWINEFFNPEDPDTFFVNV